MSVYMHIGHGHGHGHGHGKAQGHRAKTNGEKVSKNFGTEIGLEKIWYQKKSRNRYRSDFGSRHTLYLIS